MSTYKLINGDYIDKLTDIQIGKIGAHLVCADLLLKGYDAFLSDEGLPYDIIADINGIKKIQVKTTRMIRQVPQRKKHTEAYLFHIKRCGKGGMKAYTKYDFDIMALVALDKKLIGYVDIHKHKKTMHISEEKFSTLTLENI